ncbi:MAG: transcription antitermination protein NusB [Gammaproteobacteria bacterium]
MTKNLAKFKSQLKTRECLVQAIYQMGFGDLSVEELCEQFFTENRPDKMDFNYFKKALEAYLSNLSQINQTIEKIAEHPNDLHLMDKAIIQFGLNEITLGFLDKAIIIDEAIRLANKFSSPNSYRLINAVLDKA